MGLFLYEIFGTKGVIRNMKVKETLVRTERNLLGKKLKFRREFVV